MKSGSFAAGLIQSAQARYHAMSIAVMIVALFAVVDAAHAFSSNVTFCNHTTQPVEVAWGYDAVGTAETTSEGWRKVAVCACRQLFNKETRATEFWYFIKRPGTSDVLSSGRGPLCINPTRAFTFVNQNNSASSCSRAGGNWVNFAQGDTRGRSSHKLTFGRSCNL